MELDYIVLKLNEVKNLSNFEKLKALKELLPELEKYKEGLQEAQVYHLMGFAPRGSKAVDF